MYKIKRRSEMDLVLTVSEVADILKCSKVCVYKLIQSGNIRAVHIGTTKILKYDLYDYIKRLE